MNPKQFWSWKNAVESNGSELIIEGVVSSESWWGDEVTPKQLRDELKEHSGDITVSINSGGGDVFAGVAMYNALKQHDGSVTVRVDGLAASIASVIAMAGDKIIMSPGSMMMIHKPWTFAIGNSDEMDKVKEILNGIEKSIMPIYATRTGLSEEEVGELLNAETWFTAEEAVAKGFADELIEPTEKISFSDAFQAFNSQLAVSMSATKKSMKDFAHKLAESEEKVVEIEIEPAKVVEVPVEPTPTEVVEAEVEQVTEPTEEIKPVDKTKETPKMSKQDDLAVEGIVAPVAEVAATPSMEVAEYLKTDEAMEAFAMALEANPGDMGGSSSAKVRNAFKDHLEVKLGVTNPSIFLPTPLITAIQNAFEDGGEIWNRVAKVGADVWNAAWDTEDDVNSEDGRGRGYNRSVDENKAEEVLTFNSRILRPQFVYKYITLNKEDIKEQRSTGALVTYILSELPQRIVREVERAIVLGDGRTGGTAYKIQEGNPRGFYNLLDDAVADGYFGEVVTISGDQSLAEGVARAKDEIRTGGELVLIAKKGFSTDARFEKNAEGMLLFPLGSRATDVFDIDAVIEPDWFTDANSPTVDAFLVVLSAYKVVGDTTIEGFQNFILKTNKQEYLQEIWAGGGLTGRKAVIALSVSGS